jgi:hypothetical protein
MRNDLTPDEQQDVLATRQRKHKTRGSELTGASVPGMKTCTELRLLVMLDTVP